MNTAVAPHRLQQHRRPRGTNPGLRVGDVERERAATRLGQALSLGYLSIQEYDTRLQQAMQSGTAGALDGLLIDLPIERIARHDPRRHERRVAAARRAVAIHIAAYLAVSLAILGIWLAVALFVGAWYVWPIWPILGGGVAVVCHAVPVRALVRKNRLS